MSESDNYSMAQSIERRRFHTGRDNYRRQASAGHVEDMTDADWRPISPDTFKKTYGFDEKNGCDGAVHDYFRKPVSSQILYFVSM
jgi:hypothetical protein